MTSGLVSAMIVLPHPCAASWPKNTTHKPRRQGDRHDNEQIHDDGEERANRLGAHSEPSPVRASTSTTSIMRA